MRTIEYPGAKQVSLGRQLSTTLLVPRFVDIHTMAGTLNGTRSYFGEVGRAYSHFGTGGLGECEQWQDLAYRAASDREGNPWSVSFENADKGPGFPTWSGSDVPYFTDAQSDAITHAVAWVCVRLAIPPIPVFDSLPIPDGLSVHRWGIDPWRVDGGLRYSSAYGKVCPGDRRKDQFYTALVPEIQRLVYGKPVINPEGKMLVQGPNAVALVGVGFWRNCKSIEEVEILKKAGFVQPGKPLNQHEWDVTKHAVLNPAYESDPTD